jgi:hypothetical protein
MSLTSCKLEHPYSVAIESFPLDSGTESQLL